MKKIRTFMKRKRENRQTGKQADELCKYLTRIPYKSKMIIFTGYEDNWQIAESYSMMGFLDGKTTRKDMAVRVCLKEYMKKAALAVLLCSGREEDDLYGFWVAGGSWWVYPRQELSDIKKVIQV